MTLRFSAIALPGALFALFFVFGARAEDEPDAAKEDSAARRKEIKARAGSVKLSVRQKDRDIVVDPLEEPLLRYSDPARFLHDAVVFAFGSKGRPVALVTVERYPKVWAYELASLSAEGVWAVAADGWKWDPKKPALEMAAFDAAPAPADSPNGRLRQMKALMSGFTAYETDPKEERYELRLLAQPVHRYADVDAGLVDGAFFAFSYGTNPEVFVVVECRAAADGKREWSHGCIPSSSNRAIVMLDGKEIWSKPLTGAARTQTPFANFTEPAE